MQIQDEMILDELFFTTALLKQFYGLQGLYVE